MIFLHTKNPISEFITGNAIAYALYVSLMAAVFEEAGRFVAFKFSLLNTQTIMRQLYHMVLDMEVLSV